MEEKTAPVAENIPQEPAENAPVIDLERVATLRQQYIDRFFTKNPSLSMFNIPFNKQTNIRNVCVDPRIISHPLYRRSLAPHHVSSQSMVPMIVTRSLSESLCLEKSRAVLDLTRPGSLAITCMAMDKHQALLACGNERGVLSVYDVDEATFSIQLKRHVLVPTIVIDTKRSISQIVWNPRPGHEDEILLMFHFSCDAWLYNLSKLPEEAGYLRIFSPKTVRTGGSTAGLFWTSSTTVSASSQLLMVGGSNGYVRCWRIRASSTAAPEAQWSMRVTQTVSDVPVVFLYQWPGTSHLLAINALGMVAIWDVDRTEAVAFSSTGREPALIYSFDFFPLIVPYLVSPSHGQSADYASHVQQVLPVPMVIDEREDLHGTRQFMLLFQSGLLCTIDLDRQLVTDIVPRYQAARGGQSQAAPIGGRTNESMTIHMDALTASTAGHEGSGASPAGKVSVTTMVMLRSFPGTPPVVLLVQPHVDVHSKTPATAMLRFLQWVGHRRAWTRRYTNQTPSYAVTGLLRPQPGTALVQSALLKAPDFCYTLPGRVIRATPGQREIVVSADLQHYLGSVVVANSSWSRSSDLRLEWLQSASNAAVHQDVHVTTEEAAINGATIDDNDVVDEIVDDEAETEGGPLSDRSERPATDVTTEGTPATSTSPVSPTIHDDITVAFSQHCRIDAYAGQEAIVHHVQAHSVVLDRPYSGPPVVDGYPRVQLRTKLQAQHFPSSVTVQTSSVHARAIEHVTSYAENDDEHAAFLQWHSCTWPPSSSSSSSGNNNTTTSMSHGSIITSVFAHPTLPLIFLGQDDGRIVTLSTQRGSGFGGGTSTTSTAAGEQATTNVYDLYEQQQQQQQQARRLEMAAQAMAQDEALVAAETARQQNIWRADVSLSSSYRRTHTQILDARPTSTFPTSTGVMSASTTVVAVPSTSTATTAPITTTTAAPEVDEDLQLMQSIFQRNATRTVQSTSTVEQKPAQKSFFSLMRPSGPSTKAAASSSSDVGDANRTSASSIVSTTAPPRSTMGLAARSSASGGSGSMTIASAMKAPAAAAPSSTTSLSAVLAGQKRKRETLPVASSNALQSKVATISQSTAAPTASRSLLSAQASTHRNSSKENLRPSLLSSAAGPRLSVVPASAASTSAATLSVTKKSLFTYLGNANGKTTTTSNSSLPKSK